MYTKTRSSIPGAVLFLLLAACGGGGGDDGDGGGFDTPVTTTDYRVVFSPDQVLDGPAAPGIVEATASLSVDRGDDTIARGSVTVTGVTATAVTINAGYAGETGTQAVALTGGSGGTWNVPANTTLDDAEFFRLQVSGFYVRVETPQGPLRGQILPPDWVSTMVTLDAASVVPPATSPGSAVAGLAFNPQNGIYRARITLDGVDDATSAGIRNAIAGASGEVIGPLEQSTSKSNVWGSRDINNANADDTFSAPQIDLLLDGSLYYSVESVSNLSGELRGQILADEIDVLDVALTDFEVVTMGAPIISAAIGTATVTWIDVLGRLGVAVTTDAADVVSVSVHEGASGETGPVALSLAPDSALPGNWSVPVSDLSDAQADAFRDGRFYVNVVTATYPEGELRGQLTEAGPVELLSIDVTVDESTLLQVPLGASGGVLSTTTSSGVPVAAHVRPLTVANASDFSMAEIVSIDRFPGNPRLLAAVQMKPAGRVFAQPVTLDFDLTGQRQPGTILIAFRSDNNGERLELLPIRDTRGKAGLYTTLYEGTQVSVDVVGFSNIGIIEALAEEVPGLLRQFLRQGKNFELPEEFVYRGINLALDSNFTPEEIEELADNMLADFIRVRRDDLDEIMLDFMRRDELTPDDLLEYLDINLAVLLVNHFDLVRLEDDRLYTSVEELRDSLARLTDVAETYGAGLHLQCFAGTEDIEDALSTTGIVFLLRIADELLSGIEGLSPEEFDVRFEQLAAEAAQLSECFNETVLEAFFDSSGIAGDEFLGETTNLTLTTTDNVAITESVDRLPDMESTLVFVEPRLVSTDPVTIEFKEITDATTGLYTDVARVLLLGPVDGEQTGRIEIADEEEQMVASSPEDQEEGERPIVTFRFSDIGSGPIRMTPAEIEINYTFDSLETSNGRVENLTRRITGDVTVSKELSPLAFANEIELFE